MIGLIDARTGWFSFALTFGVATGVLAPTGCRGERSSRAISTQQSSTSPTAASPPSAPLSDGIAGASSSESRVILGRVVALDQPRIVRTITDAPDDEVTDSAEDIGVVLLEDSRLQAFRLSTGALLWERATAAPCRRLTLAKSMVYAGCGNKVFGFEAATGKQWVVDSRTDSSNPLLASRGAVVVVPGHNRINLYEAGARRLLASKDIPEFARAFQRNVLPNPTSDGVCVLGLSDSTSGPLSYRAGCYDGKLTRLWTKTFPFPRNESYDVRQLGPRFLVLDDQYSIEDPSLPPGPGRGLVMRWRDGQPYRFDDRTVATIEDGNGERLTLDSDVFALTRNLPLQNPAQFLLREAKVVSDDNRAFALIANHATGLAGVDRATGHVLFLIPVSLSAVWNIDIAAGMPIVRTRDSARWIVTIHDPRTGVVVYRDARPRARAY